MPRHSISYRLYAETNKVTSSQKNSVTSLQKSSSTEDDLTWNELTTIEAIRREVKSRADQPFVKQLGYWTGTCLRALTWDPMIWVTLSLYVFIRVWAHLSESDEEPALVAHLSDTNIDILGGFLSFLLVFFVNQTNTRFFEMYKLAKRCAGKVQDVAGLTSGLSPTAAHRLMRYMNAAHIVGYVGLDGPYNQNHFFEHYQNQHRLLTPSELAKLEQTCGKMEDGSATFKELCTWCQRDVHSALQKGMINAYQETQLQSHILDLRGAMDGLYDYTDQPTHFFYIHFLCMLTALYLPLFATDNAFKAGWGNSHWGVEVVSALIVITQNVFVVGLRILGQRMTDPFGEDLEDLSVITYINGTLENSRIVLNSRTVEDVNDEAEQEMMDDEVLNQHEALFSAGFGNSSSIASSTKAPGGSLTLGSLRGSSLRGGSTTSGGCFDPEDSMVITEESEEMEDEDNEENDKPEGTMV